MSSRNWEVRQWLVGKQRILMRNMTLKEAYEEWKKINETKQGTYSIYRSAKRRKRV